MSRCVYTADCAFFNSSGYSPQTRHLMRERYCLVDSTGCTRLDAMAFMPREQIPPDLLPTDVERLEALRVAWAQRDD